MTPDPSYLLKTRELDVYINGEFTGHFVDSFGHKTGLGERSCAPSKSPSPIPTGISLRSSERAIRCPSKRTREEGVGLRTGPLLFIGLLAPGSDSYEGFGTDLPEMGA